MQDQSVLPAKSIFVFALYANYDLLQISVSQRIFLFFLFGSASGISCAAEDKLDLLFIFFKCDKYFPFLQEYAARYVSYYVFVVVIVMNASIFAAR